MTKQRYNVSEVAELLLQEMDNFKASAKELKNTAVQVDEKQMEQLQGFIEQQKKTEEQITGKIDAFLADLRHFEAKRRYRLPNSVTFVVIALFVAVMAFSAYAWNQLKEVSELKAKIELYEKKEG